MTLENIGNTPLHLIKSEKINPYKNNVSILITASSQENFVNPKIYLDSEFGLPVTTPRITYSANYKNLKDLRIMIKIGYNERLNFI